MVQITFLGMLGTNEILLIVAPIAGVAIIVGIVLFLVNRNKSNKQ